MDENSGILNNFIGDIVLFLGGIFLFPIHYLKVFDFQNNLLNLLSICIFPSLFWFLVFKVFIFFIKKVKFN